MTQAGPFLELDDNPGLWVTGPTPGRTFEEWLDWAVNTVCSNLAVESTDAEFRDYARDMLRLIGTREVSPLPFWWLRWVERSEVPLVLYAGHLPRDPEGPDADELGDLAEGWLKADASAPVEPPIRDDLEAPAGTTLSRSLIYGQSSRQALAVSARYVVDTGHPEVIVLAHIASGSPADVLAGCGPVEDLLRTVRIEDELPQEADR